MGAAHKAQLGLCVGMLPDDGVGIFHPLQLRIVNHIDLRTLRNQTRTLFLGFGGQVFNVVQTDCAVGGGSRTEILQVGAVFLVQLRTQPLVHSGDIGHILHDLHTDGRAQKLRLGFLFTLDFHNPCGFPALVRQKAKIGHKARNGTHDIHDAGVAVAAGTQHGVGIDHRGGLRPAQDIPFPGLVAHLIQIAGTGKGILIHQAQFL